MTFSKTRIAVLALGTLAVLALGFRYRDALRKGNVKVTEAPPVAAAAARPAAPPVSLADGSTRDLAAPSGKLLVVHFWATWCAPCEEELPGLVAWWREAKSDPRVELVAVSVDEEWKTVNGFLAKRGAGDLPVALDPQKAAANAFGTMKFPETWFLSPSGEVLHRWIGPQDWSSPEARTMLTALEAKAFGGSSPS